MKYVKAPFIYWMNLQPWLKIIIGMILGVVVGFALGPNAAVLKPFGTAFINAIMMMVAPVVFVSLVCGVLAMRDPARMGRVALKTFIVYCSTMASGTAIALFLSTVVFNPGKGVFPASLKSQMTEVRTAGEFNLVDTLLGMVPSNITASFYEGNILQIIVFAILFGVSINLAGHAARPVEDFFHSLSAVIFKLVNIVMGFAPYGIFALMASVAGTQGLDILRALMEMVGVIYVSCLTVAILIYGSGLSLMRLNPFHFFRKMIETQVVAFSTTSSAATLPVNLKVAEHKLGVSKSIAGFVLPLGATVNMDGLSTYMGVIAVFTANLYGIELSIADMLTIVVTCTIAAVGCAGVPAAGLVVLPMILSSVGLPLEVVGLVAAVNRIIDMISTTMNVTGDAFAAVVVAKSEGELDLHRYSDGAVLSDSSDAARMLRQGIRVPERATDLTG
ncbi:MAG: dicarboxylate/amino acid:cation symporter [Deltaproteobacteria bacterium]|nr:dicarboxylate/amino acid:cation symporter [Deltaproteobacteria bacterium]